MSERSGQDDTSRRSNVVSTIQGLPPEIIGHIFQIGCPAVKLVDGALDPLEARTVRKYQIMTGSVCWAWRQISHQTPGLWTSIIVWRSLKPWSAESGEMLDAAIRYSGDLDLDIFLDDPVMRHVEDVPPSPDDVLAAVLPRVRKLVLLIGDARSYRCLIPLPKAPRLRHFELSGGSANFPSTFMYEPSAPLEVFESPRSWTVFEFSTIPAECLRSFVYGGWNTNRTADFRGFAKRCKQLERLTLKHAPPDINMGDWPSVRTANLKFPIDFPVLSALNMSHLVHVTLHLPLRGPDQEPDRTSVRSWPALPALRSLSVTAGMEWAQDIADMLDRTPNLTAFETEVRLASFITAYFIRTPTSNISPLSNMQLLRLIQREIDASGYPGSSVDYAWWIDTLSKGRSQKLKIEWWHDYELYTEVRSKLTPTVIRTLSMCICLENGITFPALSEADVKHGLEAE